MRNRNRLLIALAFCLPILAAAVPIGGSQAKPGGTLDTAIEDVLKAVRADLQSERVDILSKNLDLTGDQAAKFRPLFQTYLKEQDAILDEQLKGIQQFIESFDSLDDARALGLITAHLERDTKMVALRRQWLGRFQKALGTKLAVRVMQIDRRLSLAQQLKLTTKIPLAH